jgi:hypothetical protein
MTKHQHRRTISISFTAQVKMALHATKHGLSDNQVHGIVLGRSVKNGGGDGASVAVAVTDVVPVCHEAPTKPIVDMALRLVDAHLSQSRSSSSLSSSSPSSSSAGGARILGWYTANANANADTRGGDGETETPNPSACRIASSVAECGGNDGNYGEDFILLLVSTSRLVNCVKSLHRATSEDDPKEPRRCLLPICTAFERSSRPGGAFAQRVNDGCVTTTTTTATTGGPSSKATSDEGAEDGCARALAEAVARQLGYDKDDGGYVYDFVDHLEDFESGEDWIENGLVNSLVAALG